MAKSRRANPFQGRWIIERMDLWDVAEDCGEFQPCLEFERNDSGHFQFGCVYGEMDYRLTRRDGQSAVEFSWDGNDETEHVFGRGWAVLEGDQLKGMLFFHLGDESGFTARYDTKKSGKRR